MAHIPHTRAAVLLTAVALLIPLLLCAPGAARGQSPMKQTRDITILAFGDSLTAGYGLPVNQSLPSVLEAMLRADGYNATVTNAGVSGDTTSGGLARLSWSLEDNPDAAILELGANDGLRGQDPATMEANLDAMLKMFEAKGIPVLLAGMEAIANYGPGYASRFNAVFPRLADEHDILFYPFLLEGVALRSHLNQSDGIHPNAQGVKEIARRMYPKVRELAEQALKN